MRGKLTVGNWQMHGGLAENAARFAVLAREWKPAGGREIAVCVPFPFLAQARETLGGGTVGYGAQDVSAHAQGAYTGEVSAAMLAEFGCRYAIVGHSERRQYHGESDEQIAEKVAAAHRHGVVPIICVGETADDLETHGPSAVPVAQLRVALGGAAKGKPVVVAYEPVWAIGSGQAATSEQAQQVCAALRGVIAEVLGDDAASATRILYGGSVKASNIAGFMRETDIDGALVGGASLLLDEFSSIVRYQQHVGT